MMGTARAEEGTLGWEEAEIWVLGRMAMYSLCGSGQVMGICALLAAHPGELTTGPSSP